VHGKLSQASTRVSLAIYQVRPPISVVVPCGMSAMWARTATIRANL